MSAKDKYSVEKEWWEKMSEEDKFKLFLEWRQMKQGLCAQTLCVPTGTEDFIARAIRRAEHLSRCEGQLQKQIASLKAMIIDTHQHTHMRECWNCMGRKRTTDDNSCCICGGTGVRPLEPL